MRLKSTQFESLLEAVPGALVGMDQEGAIRFVSSQTELMFGHDREQLIGQHINALVPAVLWEVYDQHRDDFFADPQTRPVGLDLGLSGPDHNGGEFPVNVSLSHIDSGDVLLTITAVGDVTRQKQAVAKAELLDAIVEYSGNAIMGADHNGIITSWNPAANRLYGYSSKEAVGKDASLLIPSIELAMKAPCWRRPRMARLSSSLRPCVCARTGRCSRSARWPRRPVARTAGSSA